jgi:DNA-binding MarR family transcriptional regulator/GNAT superfamily N-acetyltransferase
MSRAMVADVRRFNRTVTERVGALNDRYLGRDRALGEARLLWDIGRGGAELRTLRARLGLDSGYLSRLVRSLEDAGLVTVTPSASDRRTRLARLTAAGRAERRLIDRHSDELAASLLEPLNGAQRGELVEAMRKVERLLTAGIVELRETDPAQADAQRCLAAYFAELNRRSETGFDPAAGVTAEPHELRPPAGVLLLAYLHGEPIGCGALKHDRPGVSDIKRMWVSESVRGLGIGRRMLAALEARAAADGARLVRLDTNHNLVEAIAMYRAAGYVQVARFNDEPFADHWFEKRLS